MKLKDKAYAMLAFSTVGAAMQPILMSFGRGTGMSSFFVVLYVSAIIASLGFVGYRKKFADVAAALRDWKSLLILFAIGIVLFLPTEYGVTYAENFVGASLVAVMLRTSPLLMLILLPTVLKERLSKHQIVALGLGFVGIYLAVSGGNLLGIFSNSSAGIVMLLALLAFVYAFSIILVKKYMFDMSVIMLFAGIAMLLLVLAISAVSGTGFHSISAGQAAIAVFIGIFYNVINYSIYYHAARQVKATMASNILSLSPFLTFVFAGVILSQPVYPYYIIIALLSVAGIVIQSFDRTGGAYNPTSHKNSVGRMAIFDVTGIFAGSGETGINAAINNGGRVLAVKINKEHAQHIDAMMMEGSGGIYTDAHEAIKEESQFVNDVLGTKDGEFAVMKAGRLEDGEKFFNDLYGRINQ